MVMLPETVKERLRFYFITDDSAQMPALEQVKAAVRGGVTMVQYRHKRFSAELFGEVLEIRKLCHANNVPLVINDNILLAKAADADGVHLGQEDAQPYVARAVLGESALIGVSVSTPAELAKTDLTGCDYIGTGPVFVTGSKKDPKPVIGIDGLRAVVAKARRPVVAIGGITAGQARACLDAGACGVAVVSWVSRADDPEQQARQLANACGIEKVETELLSPWADEFGLIKELMAIYGETAVETTKWIVPPGDDAAVLPGIDRPVFTTDAQVEDTHFSFSWQTPRDVGARAVAVTLSDLAAAYASPVAMFINLTLPDDVNDGLVKELYAGVAEALSHYGCALGGGNVSGGPGVALEMFAVGNMVCDTPPLRSAARPGDTLYCTGRLGLARAGLLSLQAKQVQGNERFIERFKYPRARFDAARVLAENGVACVMDISDGLSGDARHIAEASGVTIAFDLDEGLMQGYLLEYCGGVRAEAEAMVLRGGEDYELLFACPAKKAAAVAQSLNDIYRVGHCRAFSGKYLENDRLQTSFQHGRSDDRS
ncbi:MAG: thiamine-phosphate kinase [Thermodesulfobacteriota bacterium]|nr:thiamine-phosphate kinase [Thermodesulfobacteriota bacterium]